MYLCTSACNEPGTLIITLIWVSLPLINPDPETQKAINELTVKAWSLRSALLQRSIKKDLIFYVAGIGTLRTSTFLVGTGT